MTLDQYISKIEVSLEPFIRTKITEQNSNEVAKALENTLAEILKEELEKEKVWNSLKYELLYEDYLNS